jgi:hypothetical protein
MRPLLDDAGLPITPFGRPKPPGNPDWRRRAGNRTVSERHPKWERNVDRQQAKGYRCIVEGCRRGCEDVSARYCMHHRHRRRIYGHPTAGHLPRHLLGVWICEAARYLKQVDQLEDNHPAKQALVLARHWWRCQASRADGFAAVSWRAGESLETRWKRYVSTITRHGFTTDKVLALAIAFYMAREVIPGNAAADDHHERHQLARTVLFSVIPKLPSWHTRPGAAEIPGWRFWQWSGEKLQKGISLFAGSCAAAILGRSFGGYPALADTSPVPKSAAANASKRPQFRPTNQWSDEDETA